MEQAFDVVMKCELCNYAPLVFCRTRLRVVFLFVKLVFLETVRSFKSYEHSPAMAITKTLRICAQSLEYFAQYSPNQLAQQPLLVVSVVCSVAVDRNVANCDQIKNGFRTELQLDCRNYQNKCFCLC